MQNFKDKVKSQQRVTLKAIGSFLGVVKNDNQMKQWQKTMEGKMKRGEHGVSMRQSISGSRHKEQKFVKGADKLLARIKLAAEDDEKHDDDDTPLKTVSDSEAVPPLAPLEERARPRSAVSEDPAQLTTDRTVRFADESDQVKVESEGQTDRDRVSPRSKHQSPKAKKSKGGMKAKSADSPVTKVSSVVAKEKDKKKASPKNAVVFNEMFDDDQDDINEVAETGSTGLDNLEKSQTTAATEESTDNNAVLPSTSPADKGSTEQEEITTGQEAEAPDKASEVKFVYGKDAYRHYQFYVKVENEGKRKEILKRMRAKLKEYDWKIKAIHEIVDHAQAYYTNPDSKGANEWKQLKRKVNRSSSRNFSRTEVRQKLASLPEFKPFFTYFIMLAQIVSVAVLCGLGGITTLGVEPKLSLESDVQTFLGMETIHKWTLPNIWIGPDRRFLIGVGALYSPCMREDYGIQLDYMKENYTQIHELGCCEIDSRNTAATTSEQECGKITGGIGTWREGASCALRDPGHVSVAHVIKPCCTDLKGHCQLLTHKHCIFLGGIFHQTGPEHCSEVNCISTICGMGDISSQVDKPWLPDNPSQWWRLPLSLLYHHGVIHALMVTVAQFLLLRQIERTAGWFRVLIIYILSGTGGLMCAALFDPYQPHVGGTGAMAGFVGVILVELIQFWNVVQTPWRELAKIVLALVVFLFAGTLPYINNFSLIAGLIIGALTGIILLPYITFGRWQTKVRIILVVTTVPVLLVLIFFIFFVFFKVQMLEGCEFCSLINCVPYSENMCMTVH